MATIEAALSAIVSPTPISMPSSTSRPAACAAARAARGRRRPGRGAGRRRAARCGSPGSSAYQSAPAARRSRQRRRRHDAGRDHDGQPGAARTAAPDQRAPRSARSSMDDGVLAHCQIQQIDPGGCQFAADGHDLVDRLAVPGARAVAATIEAERAAIAAVRGEVDEPVGEDGVAELPPAQLAGGGEQRLRRRSVGHGEQARHSRRPSASPARTRQMWLSASDLPGCVCHVSFLDGCMRSPTGGQRAPAAAVARRPARTRNGKGAGGRAPAGARPSPHDLCACASAARDRRHEREHVAVAPPPCPWPASDVRCGC